MANVVIWVVILFTASCMSQDPPPIVLDGGVQCRSDGSTVTLNLPSTLTTRPKKVYINGKFKEGACTKTIPDDITVTTFDVIYLFAQPQCTSTKIGSKTSFKLYILHDSNYLSSSDYIVDIDCFDTKTGEMRADFKTNEKVADTSHGSNPENADPSSDFTLTFSPSVGGGPPYGPTDSVPLGTEVTMAITATNNQVRFAIKECTVQSRHRDGTTILGPYKIVLGWCSNDKTLLNDFTNSVSPDKSVSTVKAFRLTNQAPAVPITFACTLEWCADATSPICKHPDGDQATACTGSGRKRREVESVVRGKGEQKTVSSSLRVTLPGGATAGANVLAGSVHIVTLAVCLFWGPLYII